MSRAAAAQSGETTLEEIMSGFCQESYARVNEAITALVKEIGIYSDLIVSIEKM